MEEYMSKKNTSDEKQIVTLEPIKPITKEEFKNKLLLCTKQNNPEFFTEAANRNHLNLEKDKDLIDDIVYQEQVMSLQSLCFESALQENVLEAYNYLLAMSFFSDNDYAYINAVEGENASKNLCGYIDERLKNIDDLKTSISLITIVNEACLYTNTDVPNFTSYTANQIQERFGQFKDIFSSEQKAQASYICSKMYRKLAAKNVYSEAFAKNEEMECLKNVLINSSDYKLISYCQSRFANKNDKLILEAYKAASLKNKDKQALFKINMSIANIYADLSHVIGFTYPNSEKVIAAEKSIRSYMKACQLANSDERGEVLKKMSSVQYSLGNFHDWANTQSVIAYKYQKGEERCFTLHKIGDVLKDLSYYQKAIDECDKSKLSQTAKLDIKAISYQKMLMLTQNPQEKVDISLKLEQIKKQKSDNLLALISSKKGKIR